MDSAAAEALFVAVASALKTVSEALALISNTPSASIPVAVNKSGKDEWLLIRSTSAASISLISLSEPVAVYETVVVAPSTVTEMAY